MDQYNGNKFLPKFVLGLGELFQEVKRIKEQKSSYKIVEMKDDKYPFITVQLIGTKAVFDINVHDIVKENKFSLYSNNDAVYIAYIATMDEIRHKNKESLVLTGETKKQDYELKYVVKDFSKNSLEYLSASEMYHSGQVHKMSKDNAIKVSYQAGYHDGYTKAKTAYNITQNTKFKIKKTMISKSSVEFEVLDLVNKEVQIMDVTEILAKKGLLNTDDIFYLGELSRSI